MEDVRKEPGGDWVEPSLTSAPSYEDHYGAPHGVLEHMQPLGEAPSAKVKSRVRSEGPRKSVHGRSAAAVGLDAPETPEGSPAPPIAASVQVDGSIPPPAVKADDEKDDDYAPAVNKKAGAPRPKPAPRHSDATGSAKKLRAEARKGGSSAKKRVYDPAKLQRVVESAKARAMEVGKPDLAAAVHEIWVESLKSVHLTDLLEAILTTTATAAQTEDFQNHVKRAKKRLRDAKEKHRKKPAKNNTNGTQALPLRSPSNSTSQPVPPPTTNFAVPSTEHTDSSKTRLSLKVKSPTKQARRRPEQGGKMASLPPKSRARSGSETSELTDLTSDGEGPLPPGEADQLSHGPPSVAPKTNGIHGKDHAAERGSLAAPGGKMKRSSAEAELDDEGWEREKVIITKKAKLGETVTRNTPYQESDMRSSAREARQSRTTRTKPTSLVPPSITLPAAGSRAASARGSRAPSMNPDSPLTDISTNSSRLSTPRIMKTAPKAPGKRAKTKNSPEKKHLAGYGGLSVAGGAGRESPIGDDDNEELSENNDFCSACGGSGFLLCCDGCDRSFHFSCLDPPLNDEASELNEPWFCYICVAKRPIASEQPDKLPQRGLFAPLFSILKKQNPSNFALPLDIRDYFEGVQADGNGNFIEALHSRTRNRAGYDELPDHYKLKDNKGKTVLCYHCSKSSQGQPPRPIIQCDYCSESWHLDCLDPPMANPPARSWDGKKIHDWMCPLHADQELRRVDASLLVPRRKVHVRRPRNPKIVDAALTRGFQNNGVIDVQDEESGDDSDAEFYEEESPDEPNEPVIHRMPARGIKLDFIDRIKSTRMQDIRNQRIHKRPRTAPPSVMQQANFARRSFAEKQLALNLAQFASANKDLELGSDQVDNLVGALIAEAPSEVVEEFMAAEGAAKQKANSSAPAVIPPWPPNSDQTDIILAGQRKQLRMLQELIRRKLESSKT
ncbi:hypothetical protein LTS16_018514 [Friedmanniomyces endolithicus]|nr:hypothetical protein LTR57_018837 [Friedmanniomyces endolithicus]KAK0973934.1 hypothetical protein LTS01_014354 [Friedmanniomyces endolithicus]KAK1030853.1 hypothetical protein LTS16_018514 [Friedmanniomyces endolithicus]